MRVDLNDKATTKALAASGQLNKSAAEVTNSLLEHLEAMEIVEIVTMQFKKVDERGRIRHRIVKKISTSKWVKNY